MTDTVATPTRMCQKRNGGLVVFDSDKIRSALRRGFDDVPASDRPADVGGCVEAITAAVVDRLDVTGCNTPDVEHVQRLVIQQLWIRSLFSVAEAYQNYREDRRKVRDHVTAPVFTVRRTLKPYEYPDLMKYRKAVTNSYWLVDHWTFQSDVQDFKVNMTPTYRSIVCNALLAISQVEVAVKMFWVRLGDRFRKPEFAFIGVTFGESEVRHAESYSHLLEVLDLNREFSKIADVPAIRGRVGYLSDALATSPQASDREYVFTLALFALFVENVSLFGQFYVVQAFHKHLQVLKDVDNVIQATRKEETVHALFGIELINLVRAQRPEWFDAAFYTAIAAACRKAYTAELAIIDWIFEAGEPSFLPKSSVVALIESRFNAGLEAIGGRPLFTVDPVAAAHTAWFEEEQHADVSTDFFHKRPVTYARFTQSVTVEDLF